jgi:hypothetical protein
MASASLVNHGEDLEVDLVDTPGEMGIQRRTVLASDQPGHEAIRQTPLDQICRPGVQPVLVEAEVSRNRRPRGQERVWERLRKIELPLVGDSEDIHVSGSTPHKAERRERGAMFIIPE